MYNTSDLFLASYLAYCGHTLEYIDKSQKRALFFFKQTTSLHNDVADFEQRKGRAEPYKLFNAQRDMKDRLYN